MKRIAVVAAMAVLLCTQGRSSTIYNFSQVSPGNQAESIFVGAAINSSGLVAWENGESLYTWNGSAVSQYGNFQNLGQGIGLSDAGGISFSYESGGAVYSIPNGTVTSVAYPGADGTTATGSSPDGMVTGYSYTGPSQYGFIDDGGSFTQVSYPGPHGQIYLWGINDSSNVVGISSCCDSGVGFIDENGVYTTITVPGITNGDIDPRGLNDSNEVVGEVYTGSDLEGFVWQNGVGSIVNYPGATDTIIYGVNSAGELVGEADFGQYYSGIVFTATPEGSTTPEPRTFYLLAGAALAGWRYRHRR